MQSLSRRQALGLFGASAASVLAVSGCGAATSGSSGQDTGRTRKPGQSVTLSFWSWAPGVDKAVALWNKQHPGIRVEFEQIEDGGYARMFAGLKAGQAPDLAQIEYSAIPSFLLEDGLVDLNEHGAAKHKDKFVDWTWQQGAVGDSVFAIPQASGPMALFYREDLFRKWNIDVPTTWAEYEQAARAVRAADPKAYLTSFSPASPDWFTGLAWQAGARWFSANGGEWTVNIDSAETRRVTGYWQRLIDDKLVKTVPDSSAEWYRDLQRGRILSWVAGSWGDAIIEGNAPGTAGKWRVAPMPSWDANAPASANHGGSATAVLAGSDYRSEALEFAVWLNSHPDSLNILLDGGIGWPAAKNALELEALSKPSPFFGGQRYNEVFAKMDDRVDPNWTWPPTTTATSDGLIDGFQRAIAGKATLTDALGDAQRATVQAFRDKGITVAGGN